MLRSTFMQLRSVSLIAVIALFAGSILMFLAGLLKTIGAFLIFFSAFSIRMPDHLSESSLATVSLIQAVDAFLFALVLMIFSYAIYILFVHSFTREELEQLPKWMQIESIGELKTTLLQVIIVILAVNLLEHVILVGPEALKWETLIIPGAILCLAAALRLMHVSKD
ncbi:MAG: YqhA family protein [Methanomicrobiales archaeon]|nr:YqhA family protein [Methanomicrobiales archaeon]